MNIDAIVKSLNEKLSGNASDLKKLDEYYDGDQPAAFMSRKAREALDYTLTSLAVNVPKLLVKSLSERLEVTGFRTGGDADDLLWAAWKRNRLRDGSAQAHTDALVYGRSFLIVWADPAGRATVTVESPLQVAVTRDPVSRQVTAALKRWVDSDGYSRAALYLPYEVRLLVGSRVVNPATATSYMAPTDGFISTGWKVEETLPNPFGVVPVVPVVNRGRLSDVDGRSEMEDILGLTDALNKIMADALVSSEFYARPRRWVTGLQTEFEDDDSPVYPFTEDSDNGHMFIAEQADVKFGQFDPSDLTAYSNLASTLTAQMGALSGLPPHYLGIHGDQPASADAIRSAEASLVSRCMELQRTFGQAWADVARLIHAVESGADPLALDIEPVWSSPETRTPAQSADAAAKLAGIGVPLRTLLGEVMGWSPEAVDESMNASRSEALLSQVTNGPVAP